MVLYFCINSIFVGPLAVSISDIFLDVRWPLRDFAKHLIGKIKNQNPTHAVCKELETALKAQTVT